MANKEFKILKETLGVVIMITREEILKEAEVIFKDKLMIQHQKPLSFEIDEDLGLDSIMTLELIVEMEIKYNIEIDESELSKNIFSNIKNFVNFIFNKIEQKESCNLKK